MMGVAAVISTERLGTTGFDAVGGGGWKALCWSGCWCCIPSAICPDPFTLLESWQLAKVEMAG